MGAGKLMLIAVWPVLFAAYLLLVGRLSADEVGLAVACGLAATAWVGALAVAAKVRFRFEPAAAGTMARAFAGLPLGVAKTARALVRGHGGRVVRRPFVAGRERDPDDVARRAVVVLAVSLAPDRFAVRIPEGQDQIELHSLAGPPAESDARWPV